MENWVNQHVAKLTGEQKKYVALYLVWKLKYFDAGMTATLMKGIMSLFNKLAKTNPFYKPEIEKLKIAQKVAANSSKIAGKEALKEKTFARKHAIKASHAIIEAEKIARKEKDPRTALESLYVALWNKDHFGQKTLLHQLFPAPIKGKIEPLYNAD